MIVITGGSGRLGGELVKLFKADQKTVVSISRSKNKDADFNFIYDLSSSKSVIAAAKEVADIYEPLEAIINAAGIFTANPLGKITEEEVRQNMAINVEAPILLISNLIDRIKKDGTDIVNISSMGGVNAAAGIPVYGSSKWALRGFSGNLRAALKQSPCRVLTVYPGSFDSDIIIKSPAKGDVRPDSNLMATEDVAEFIKQLLDMPKNMEVSEVMLNRTGQND